MKYKIGNIHVKFISQWKKELGKWKISRGFTLIELLIYAGLLSILLSVFVTLFGMIIDAQLESNASSSVQQDGQYILARLSHDITNSTAIVTPSALGSQSATLRLTINATATTYSLTSGNLMISTPTGSDVLNSYGTAVSNLQFTRYGNINGKNSIRFTYTVTGKTIKKSGTESQSFTTTAAMR